MAALYNSCHVGSGIAASLPGLQGSAGVAGYCASAKITIARSKLSAFSRSCGRIISNETDPKECGLEVCYEIAHLGVGSRPDWLGLLRVRLEFSASFASRRS